VSHCPGRRSIDHVTGIAADAEVAVG